MSTPDEHAHDGRYADRSGVERPEPVDEVVITAADVDPSTLPRPQGYAAPAERPRGAGASLMISGMCVVMAVVLAWTWWSRFEQPDSWTSGLFLWCAAAVVLFALGLAFWALDGVRLLAPIAILIGIGMFWTTCGDMLSTFAGAASGDLPDGIITWRTTLLWALQLLAGILAVGGATVELGGPIRR